MKRLLICWLLFSGLIFAQNGSQQNFPGAPLQFSGVPTGTCNATQLSINTVNGDFYDCPSGSWVKAGTGGSSAVFSSIGVSLVNDSTPYVANNPILTTWGAALRNAPNQAVNVAIIGDSVGAGVGVTKYSNSWAVRLANDLFSLFGRHGYGLIPATDAQYGWSTTGSWANVSGFAPYQLANGGSAVTTLFSATGASNTYNLTAMWGDTVTVYTASNTDSAGCTVTVDGGTNGTFTTFSSTSGSLAAHADSFAASNGFASHTLTVKPTAANACYFFGAEWSIGTTGVSVHNMAISATRSDAFGSDVNNQLAYLPLLNGGAPQLVVIALGINDLRSGVNTLAQYQTNLQNVITYVKALSTPSPSILIVDPHIPTGITSSFTQAQMLTTEENLAISNNVAFTSISKAWGSLANAQNLSLMNADNIHPNDKGHGGWNYVIEQALIQWAPPSLLGDTATQNTATSNSIFLNPTGNYGYVPGELNTAFGYKALYVVGATSKSDTAIGAGACQGVTGNFNTCLGQGTGGGAIAGSNNVFLGQNANGGSSSQGSAQIGSGTNNTANTLQFQSYNFLDSSGNATFASDNTADGSFGSKQTSGPSACETAFAATTLSTVAVTTNTGLNCLPANSVIDAVVYRITTTITTAANFTIGDATTAARFCATQSTLTSGTTGICFAQADQTGAPGPRQTAAAAVRVTTNVNPAAGVIRLIVYYHTWTAPTS